MSTNSLNFYILIAIFIRLHNCLTQVANFPEIPLIKSGDHKAVISRLSPNQQITRPQGYSRTFSSTPKVAIGILIFEIEAGANMAFTVDVTNVGTTGFSSVITAKTDTFINQLYYTYIAVEPSGLFGLFPLVTWTLNSSLTNSNLTDNFPIGSTVNTAHQIVVSVFIKDFSAARFNSDISIKLDARILSATRFELTLFTNSTVSAVTAFVFWVDKTALSINQIYFLDYGFGITEYQARRNYTNFVLNPSAFNYFNFMRGVDWISFSATASDTLFSVKLDQFPFATLTSYKITRANFLLWRERRCPTSTYFYMESQTKCYDTCPAGYSNNNVHQFCQICHYSCKNCLVDGITCTLCPDNSHRLFSNGSCLCGTGFFDDGNATCGTCDYTCATCVNTATKCQSCDPTRDYNNVTNVCTCKSRMFDTQVNSPVCSTCHYSCASCVGTANTCSTCSSVAHRLLVISSCLCASGFTEPTPAGETCVPAPALVCSANCLTCQNTASECTGCDTTKNRQLQTDKTCQCKSGYSSSDQVSTCTQVCGDGRRFQLACDDGNTLDGDGCSASCAVETNFICDTSAQPNACIYKFAYTITLESLLKRSDQNILDLVFKISPVPPANSVASLSSVPITILSQSLNRGILTIAGEYKQSIPLASLAKLSLSTIPNTINFQVKTDDGLQVTYYTTQNYNAYKAQVILVWLFVGLFWIVVIACLMFYKKGILPMLEFACACGLAWVGATVVPSYGIYHQPLLNLVYIFGYNQKIANEDGMLAYLNYGLITIIVPFVIVASNFILQKIKPQLGLTQQSKKYVAIQITLAIITFNSIIAMYGLTTQAKTRTYTALSIASIILGIVYFIILALLCALFLRKTQHFIYMTELMMGRRGTVYLVGVVIWSKLAVILTYSLVCFTTSLKYAPIIVAVSSIAAIVLTVVVRPYQNNLRVILHETMLTVIFLCYYLALEIPSAEWAPFLVLILLYFGLLANSIALAYWCYRDKNVKKLESEFNDNTEYQRSVDHNGNENVDMDFDPHKIINESRMMDTVKKDQFQADANRFVVSPTVRKGILDTNQ